MEFWQKILGNLNHKMIFLGALGILFILLGNWQSFLAPAKGPSPVVTKESKEVNSPNLGKEEQEKSLETDLEDILSKIEGVGQIKVRVILASGKQYEYAYNQNVEKRVTEEKDQQGGTRITTETKDGQQMIIVRDTQSNSERPVILKELRPPVKGVIVVAEGAKDSLVKSNLLQAVHTVLGIPVYKVTVMPME